MLNTHTTGLPSHDFQPQILWSALSQHVIRFLRGTDQCPHKGMVKVMLHRTYHVHSMQKYKLSITLSYCTRFSSVDQTKSTKCEPTQECESVLMTPNCPNWPKKWWNPQQYFITTEPSISLLLSLFPYCSCLSLLFPSIHSVNTPSFEIHNSSSWNYKVTGYVHSHI